MLLEVREEGSEVAGLPLHFLQAAELGAFLYTFRVMLL